MDTGGLLGPHYNYADELKMPSEIGVERNGSAQGITRAVAGVNYYMDAIGFGGSTLFAKGAGMEQHPLGINYFIGTGATCSNGADMYEYISTIPSGNSGRVGKEIRKTLGVDFRGLAPGILEDAAGALNPLPMFNAVTGSGYPQCKKVTKPVGDLKGKLRSSYDSNNVWIKDPVKMAGNSPQQTRWVFDKYITMEEYDNTKKTEKEGKLPEGFRNIREKASSPLAAGVLFAALFLGIVAWKSSQ
jgi:hypothetical protein